MNPNSITRARPNNTPIPNKRMTTIHHRINHGIHHPSIERHLSNIVNYHALCKKEFHIVLWREEGFGNVTQCGETDEVKEGEGEGYLVGVHGDGEAGCGIACGVGEMGPEGDDAGEDGGGGVPGQHGGRFVFCLLGHGFFVIRELSL